SAHTITGSFDGARGAFAIDLDDDGDMDVLGAAEYADDIAWWENDGSQNFTEHTINAAFDGAYAVCAEDLDDDGDKDVIGVAYNGDDVYWWENDGAESFTQHTLLALNGPCSVMTEDIDGDNDPDILVAARVGGYVTWYENRGLRAFQYHHLTTSLGGAYSAFAADVTGDGHVDVFASAASLGLVACFENNADCPYHEFLIGSATQAYSLDVVDFNSDERPDVFVNGYQFVGWLENEGGNSYIERLASDTSYSYFGCAADVNGDASLDIITASTNWQAIHVYENTGEGFSGYQLAGSIVSPLSTIAADLDGDEDNDIVCAMTGSYEVRWYENLGGRAWAEHVLAANISSYELHAVDIDDDNDIDLLAADYYNDRILWWENLGGGSWSENTLAADYNSPYSVYSTDLDLDGDFDILSSASADNVITWWENDGSEVFTRHDLAASSPPWAVRTADWDLDGDIDIFSSSSSGGTITRWENNGLMAFIPSIFISGGVGNYAIRLADVDQDWDPDLLAAQQGGVVLFTNELPHDLTLTEPNGGETWLVSQNDTVRWTSLGYPGPVKIELNRNYPVGEWEMLADSIENDGEEVFWTTEPVSGNCRIRVSSWIGHLIDESDADFSISTSQGYLAPVLPETPSVAVQNWNTGSHECPETAVVTYKLKNFGSQNITITDIDLYSGAHFFVEQDCPALVELMPGEVSACTLAVYFDAQFDGTFSDTLLLQTNASNAVNGYVRIPLTGTQYSTPTAPEVVITEEGINARLSWDPIEESIGECPVEITAYLVFYADNSEGPYLFHGLTTDTTYLHTGVVHFAPAMYYHMLTTTEELPLLMSLPVDGTLTEEAFLKLYRSPIKAIATGELKFKK
ncbi:VCBS repeat-containing protein, partial [bacterium]|nr:VCBS repeat-containing protein [bacterium]